MKKLTFGIIILLVLFFVAYAVHYRQSDTFIRAIALVQNGRTLYLPQHRWSCAEDGGCTVRLNDDVLHVAATFQPAGSPFGQCQARYDGRVVPCTVRQHYYYRFGDTMRPYLVLQANADVLPLTAWQVIRFRVETIVATLALGEESAWTLVTGAAALAAGGLAFRFIRQAFVRRLPSPERGGHARGLKKALLAAGSLVVSVALAAAFWIAALFTLFATGVMVD